MDLDYVQIDEKRHGGNLYKVLKEVTYGKE